MNNCDKCDIQNRVTCSNCKHMLVSVENSPCAECQRGAERFEKRNTCPDCGADWTKKEDNMNNHWPQIAAMMGVELGEEFRIPNNSHTFLFTKEGLRNTKGDEFNDLMLTILTQGIKIKKIPKFPEHGTEYFSIRIDGVVGFEEWSGRPIDKLLFKLGNYYHSRKEVEDNRQKWIKFYSDASRIEWEGENDGE